MTNSKGTRTVSASEIARNTSKFETWSSVQNCSLATQHDIPVQMREDVRCVFAVKGLIPRAIVDDTSPIFLGLKNTMPTLVKFLQKAHAERPLLFSAESSVKLGDVLQHLCNALSAWQKLKMMKRSTQRWTEADYAGQVYNLIRTPAVSRGRLRLQCPMSLPEPPIAPLGLQKNILAARSVIPDGATFISSSNLAALTMQKNSAFNTLKKAIGPKTKFREEATPAANVPDKERFEFASSVWEDKKPDQTQIDNAWRQNRMSTAAIARHYHAFNVDAPVFGLVWGEGTVRAHIDWACVENGRVCVYSAPYIHLDETEDRRDSGLSGVSTVASGVSGASVLPDFHVWDLASPAAIIEVYLVIRNIDAWTHGKFTTRVIDGVKKLTESIKEDKTAFTPWKKSAKDTVTSARPSEDFGAAKKENAVVKKRNEKVPPSMTLRSSKREGLRTRKGPNTG